MIEEGEDGAWSHNGTDVVAVTEACQWLRGWAKGLGDRVRRSVAEEWGWGGVRSVNEPPVVI